MRNKWREDRPMSQDMKDFLNGLGWIAATMFGGFVLTMPMWFWVFGLC